MAPVSWRRSQTAVVAASFMGFAGFTPEPLPEWLALEARHPLRERLMPPAAYRKIHVTIRNVGISTAADHSM